MPFTVPTQPLVTRGRTSTGYVPPAMYQAPTPAPAAPPTDYGLADYLAALDQLRQQQVSIQPVYDPPAPVQTPASPEPSVSITPAADPLPATGDSQLARALASMQAAGRTSAPPLRSSGAAVSASGLQAAAAPHWQMLPSYHPRRRGFYR